MIIVSQVAEIVISFSTIRWHFDIEKKIGEYKENQKYEKIRLEFLITVIINFSFALRDAIFYAKSIIIKISQLSLILPEK